MYKRLYYFSLLIVLILLLTSCSKQNSIVGLWEDDEGYMVSFTGEGLIESIYGKELSCSDKDGKIIYQWPDGFTRSTDYYFGNNGELFLYIADKGREFHRASQRDISRTWNIESIDHSVGIKSKYYLIGNTGVSSEIYLLENNSYSITYNTGSIPVKTYYNAVDDEVSIGMYSDRGPGGSLILYSINADKCEVWPKSDSDKYLATGLLVGEITEVKDDYSSPVDCRGYLIEGFFTDEANGISYLFDLDNNMIKTLPDSTEIYYAYFIDREGLVKLACIDTQTNSDFMWLNITKKEMYNVVYQRDDWTEYLFNITYTVPEVEKVNSNIAGLNFNSTVIRQENNGFLCPEQKFLGSLYGLVARSKLAIAQNDYNNFMQNRVQLSADMELKRQREEERQKEKDRFMARMSVLAEQRKYEEQLAFYQYDEYMRGQGYVYDEDLDIWRIPGRNDSYVQAPDSYIDQLSKVLNESGLSIPDNIDSSNNAKPSESFDSTPENFISSFPIRSNIKFFCTCSECYKESMPVGQGESNIAVVDLTIWRNGMTLFIGEHPVIQVITRDGSGFVTGNNMNIYLSDHSLKQSLADGTFKVSRNLDN